MYLKDENNEGLSRIPNGLRCFCMDLIKEQLLNTDLIWIWKHTISFSDCVWPQILYWVSAWICSTIGFAWISNRHNIWFMEVIWAFFLSLHFKPLAKQLSQCTLFLPFVSPLSQTLDFYRNTKPRMKVSNLTLG